MEASVPSEGRNLKASELRGIKWLDLEKLT